MSQPDQILPRGRVLRYAFAERLNHWLAAFSYIYLLLTGLAFWSADKLREHCIHGLDWSFSSR